MKISMRAGMTAFVFLSGAIVGGVVGQQIIGGVAYAQSQADMNTQAGEDYKKADAEMTAAYQRLMKKIDKAGQAKLRNAQRAWLKFRDAEADFRASKVEGGSAYPMVHSSYLSRLTNARAEELRNAYKQFTTDGEM